MDPMIETYRGVVYPWHCDHMGHMNVAWYTAKFDEATWILFSHLGITASYMRERDRGMVAVKQEITYSKELVAGDVVFVRSRMLEAREKVLRFAHQLIHAESDEVAAVSELVGVHIDRRERKSCALPPEILERARASVLAK
jgi:acyl-CoA thioester hydrolase